MAPCNDQQLLHSEHIPTIWRQSKIIAILKPMKYCDTLSHRPMSLLCHTYKLYKRWILYRIAPTIEEHIIKEQASFRHRMLCTSQLLNLIQHIENDFQDGKITETVFVDLSAAYGTVKALLSDTDTVQYHTSKQICTFIQNKMSNRRFYVELNNEHSR